MTAINENHSLISIDELSKLDLHDVDIEELQICFPKNNLRLKFEIYNDIQACYEDLELLFHDVGNLSIGEFQLSSQTNPEIFSHELEIIDKGKTKIKFILLLGESEPSTELSFVFRECYKRT